MTGRITKDKKSGTYCITIETASKGNRKRKVKKNFKAKREAKVALGLYIAELQEEMNNDNSKYEMCLGDYKLQKAYKRAGLKDSRFHDLRHSHASILLQKNVHPKIVSERLGHSKIGITLDIYSHAIPSLQEQAINVFDYDEE